MRISPRLIFLFFAPIFFLPHSALCQEDDEQAKLVIESLRKSLDGLETDRSKIRWDERGFRVEEKNWEEKAGDWLNSLFEGKKRRKREAVPNSGEKLTNGNGVEVKEDPEELIRVNAKIVFYKNGTRLVDIQNGPLIVVTPKGQITLDYRNGTVQKIGENGGESGGGISRNKRFATLDDLYMAHGFEFDQTKDAADFGREIAAENGQSGGGVKAIDRADDSSSGGRDDEGEWQWGRAEEQKNAYWDKPLYGAANGGGNGQNGQNAVGGNRPQQSQGIGQSKGGKMQQSSAQQFQQPAAPPKSTIWETFETPTRNGGGGANSQNQAFQQPQGNGGQFVQQSPSQPSGQSNFGQQNSNSAAAGIHPPSPSPSTWLQSQMHSQQPLSPEELELAKELMRRIVEQENKENGANNGGGTTNGGSKSTATTWNKFVGGNNGGEGNGQRAVNNNNFAGRSVGNVGGRQPQNGNGGAKQPGGKGGNNNVEGGGGGLPKWAQPKAN